MRLPEDRRIAALKLALKSYRFTQATGVLLTQEAQVRPIFQLADLFLNYITYGSKEDDSD